MDLDSVQRLIDSALLAEQRAKLAVKDAQRLTAEARTAIDKARAAHKQYHREHR